MTIAVHIDLRKQRDTASQAFLELFTALAETQPSSHFIFIFDQPSTELKFRSGNITPVFTTPQIKNSLLRHYFYNFKLPRLLSKYNADIFCSNGISSLRTQVRQAIFLHDLSFESAKNSLPGNDSRYLRRFARKFFQKAAGLIISNASLKIPLEQRYGIPAKKIYETSLPLDLKPLVLDEEINDSTRSEVGGGRQYFIFLATPLATQNIVLALKAFSIFKKWQKSQMKLVILNLGADLPISVPNLSTYKFRDDVQIIHPDSMEKSDAIIGAAYAAVYLPEIDQVGTAGLRALACGVPLITSSSAFQRAVFNDAALYTELDEKTLGTQLMKIYKDESERKQLIQEGKNLISGNELSKQLPHFWEILQSL